MKVTCLGLGVGQGASTAPTCYLLKMSSTQLLLECPIDMSALLLFLPTLLLPECTKGHQSLERDSGSRFGKLQRTGIGLDNRKPIHDEANGNTTKNGQKSSFLFKVIEGRMLLDAEPWYKTSNLGLVDVSSLNAVLISNPEGMLGLPFLVRMPEFSAEIYATSATAKLGQLMMEELVTMHEEYVQIFGLPDYSGPRWLQPLTLSAVPDSVRTALVGDDGIARANWRYIYSKSDIRHCMEKVCCLHYGEEANIDDLLVIKPCSSGLEIGSSNWVISGTKQTLSYMSASIFATRHAMGLDLSSLEGTHMLLFSDLKRSIMDNVVDIGRADSGVPAIAKACEKTALDACAKESRCDSQTFPVSKYHGLEGPSTSSSCLSHAGSSGAVRWVQARHKSESSGVGSLVAPSGKLGKMGNHESPVALATKDYSLHGDPGDKLLSVCKAAVDAVKKGGSVLVTISGLGTILELLEVISDQLRASNLGHIPMFYISPAAKEALAFANTVPEWLCASRQEKLYAGEALFGHVELLQEKRLHHLPALHSTELVNVWREPCVVFAAHWSLRMGPAVHLLHHWRENPLCLLIATQAFIDLDLLLSPFKPVVMQTLQYPVPHGLSSREVASIVQKLKPNLIMLPGIIKSYFQEALKHEEELMIDTILFYDEGDTMSIPNSKDIKIDMSTDLALQIQPKKLENGIAFTRMTMGLQLKDNRWYLESPSHSEIYGMELSSLSSRKYHWGRIEVHDLLKSLREHGMYCFCANQKDELRSQEKPDEADFSNTRVTVVVTSPSPARVEVTTSGTFIEANDPIVMKLITDVVKALLHVI